MFQTNDPRFWKAVAGIVSLILKTELLQHYLQEEDTKLSLEAKETIFELHSLKCYVTNISTWLQKNLQPNRKLV